MMFPHDKVTGGAMEIRFDFNNMMASQLGVGLGITEEKVESQIDLASQAHQAVEDMRRGGRLEWADLPYRRDSARQIASWAKEVADRFENFVVLGIGGSALGAIALHQALNHPWYNLLPERERGPRMFFLDNVDPDLDGALLDIVDPAHTLFNVITKSGSTAETMAQFLVFRQALQHRLGDRYREHLVATTDPISGALRQIASGESLRTFDVPPGVGGRFSVLSPVGLVPAAISGIDIDDLLAGAALASKRCDDSDARRNPALMNALLHFVADKDLGRDVVVMMPYNQALLGVADWFRQLWAESLGKRVNRAGAEVRVGTTLVKALGTTDQHSQVQLYVEGPRNKVVNFLAVERWHRDVPIPVANEQELSYLGGHSLAELMNAEREATELALTKAGQCNCSLILPEVTAFTVGQLLFLLELQTAYAGELYDVDAFNQPGVEEGKIATYALLGRPGYEQQRADIEARRGRRASQYVI